MARRRATQAACDYRSLLGLLLGGIVAGFVLSVERAEISEPDRRVAAPSPAEVRPSTAQELSAWPSKAAEEQLAPAEPRPSQANEYGFYMHVHGHPAAVIHQVREIKKWFPGSPIYVMSDGNMDFSRLCAKEGCTFVLCPPANDRWHPWPFLRRLYDAAVALKTDFVILLEPDNTIHGPIKTRPQFDAGGLHVKDRSFAGADYVEPLARARVADFKWTKASQQAGLCGGSYYRTAAILDAFSDENVAKIDWNMLGEKFSKELGGGNSGVEWPWSAAPELQHVLGLDHWFKNDPFRLELGFGTDINSTGREDIRQICKHLGLNFRCVGDGTQKRIMALKLDCIRERKKAEDLALEAPRAVAGFYRGALNVLPEQEKFKVNALFVQFYGGERAWSLGEAYAPENLQAEAQERKRQREDSSSDSEDMEEMLGRYANVQKTS
ncbi:unnamed protein product [Effrenium voratum]|uniref:Uncharacterized protein n=1 Tax=Effrenium voratum TaxID=2562239 RepID=A0AA36N6I5_9DINO|nr:unnamed protein product [Effrenium voratum]